MLERNSFPEGHPFRSVHAIPADVALPPIWLLGSSGYSAELAAAAGMGFAFAHHFAQHDAASAMLTYRENFKPSATLPEPYAILATAAIAADTGEEAERIAASADLNFVYRARGEHPPFQSPTGRRRLSLHAGSIATVSRGTASSSPSAPATMCITASSALAETTHADELMITTNVFDHAARRRSYQLLAEAFALTPTVEKPSTN